MFTGVDPVSKRRRYRSITVRGNRGDAERALAEMVAAAQAARAVGVRSSVSELLEAWYAVAATGWAPTTIRQTRSVRRRYLHPHLGDVAVSDLTPAMIDATYATLRRGGGINGQSLSPGTLARVHVVLRAALGQAMRWGWIWDNPAERAHRIIATRTELHPPTPHEVRTLLEHVAVRDPQLHVLLTLAAVTGAPPGPAARAALAQRASGPTASVVLRRLGRRPRRARADGDQGRAPPHRRSRRRRDRRRPITRSADAAS